MVDAHPVETTGCATRAGGDQPAIEPRPDPAAQTGRQPASAPFPVTPRKDRQSPRPFGLSTTLNAANRAREQLDRFLHMPAGTSGRAQPMGSVRCLAVVQVSRIRGARGRAVRSSPVPSSVGDVADQPKLPSAVSGQDRVDADIDEYLTIVDLGPQSASSGAQHAGTGTPSSRHTNR